MLRPPLAPVLLSVLITLPAAGPALAQTVDAGTPVVSVHTTDEVSPTLVRDGTGGAFVGFQTIAPATPGDGTLRGIIHVVRLRPDASPDPEWSPSQADAIWLSYSERTNIAPIGSGRVWAVGNAENLPSAHYPNYYMLQVDSGGVTAPPLQAGRGSYFVAWGMQALGQPDGHALILYMLSSYFNEPGLLVDRVAPDGGITHLAIDLGISYTSDPPFLLAALAGADGSAITILGGSAGSGLYLYAVGIHADGSAVWAPAARPLCTITGPQKEASCASDGAGGLFVAWRDSRSATTGPDLYATHMLADGTLAPGWPVNGKAIAATTGEQSHANAVADGAGGLWLVWTDVRSGTLEVYYTHLHADGTPAAGFTLSGRPLSNAQGSRLDPLAVSDGTGGLFAVWRDGRNLVDFDLFGQHILADGSVAPGLAVDGEPICTNPTDQTDLALLDIGANAAIVTWRDNRTGVGIQYAARVPAGNVGAGVPPPHAGRLELARIGAQPARGAIEYAVSTVEAGEVSVRLIDAAGRVVDVRTLPAGAARTTVRFTPARPGLYFVSAAQGSETATSRVAFVR